MRRNPAKVMRPAIAVHIAEPFFTVFRLLVWREAEVLKVLV
jgi:hypothetical protein